MSTTKSRIKTDVMKLLMSDYNVNLVNDNLQEFNVKFLGPKGTLYEGGTWKIHVELPSEYPYKSPSIGFLNKIYHPNIDESSGSVCLDVINQTWSPMFDVFNIFEIFLPQLLSYPNAADPLNSEASQLYNNDSEMYEKRVKDYVQKYASDDAFEDDEDDSQEDDDELSSAESVSSEDDEEEDDDEEDEEEDDDEEIAEDEDEIEENK